jgi:hypothetical protein
MMTVVIGLLSGPYSVRWERHTGRRVPTFKRDHDWKRWAGTTEDIATLAIAVEGALLAAAPEEPLDTSFTISVQMPGMEEEYATPAEFSEGATALDLGAVTSISVRAIYVGPSRGNINITFTRLSSAVRVYVSGNDQRWVNGTFVELDELLEPGSRWTPSALGYLFFALPLSGVALVWLLPLDRSAWRLAGFVVDLALLGLALLAGAGWAGLLEPLFPTLDLVPTGGQTRSQRFALSARSAGRGLIWLTMGAIIYALAARLI